MASATLSGAAKGAAAGSAFGPWGTAIGGAVGLLGGLFNKKKAAPKVGITPVDPQKEQQDALAGNIAAQGSIEELLTRANRYSQGEANSLMEQAVPGFGNLSKKFLGLAESNVDDPYGLPDDVKKNISRIAAERGVSTGVRGQAGEFSALRDFGVNMLDYGQARISQAQSLLQTIVGLSPRVSPMSPLSFYVTPQQQTAVTAGNAANQQAIDQGHANAVTAAGNFNTSNLWDSIAQASGMLGGYLDTKTAAKKP